MLVEEAEERCRALLHVRGLVRGGQPPHKEQEACTLACLRRDTHTRLSPSLFSLPLSSLSLSLCLSVSLSNRERERETERETEKFIDNQIDD